MSEIVTKKISKKAEALATKWYDILNTHIPEAIGTGEFLVLKMNNKGRSDIVSWKLQIKVWIEPGAFLTTKYNTRGDQESWELNSAGAY
jgi:hypothetical protein